MTGAKISLSAAALISAINPTEIESWKSLGLTGCLMVAVYFLWRDGAKRQDKQDALVDRASAALAQNAESMKVLCQCVVELKDSTRTNVEVIKQCHDITLSRIKEHGSQ